jgi:hypothetical protein
MTILKILPWRLERKLLMLGKGLKRNSTRNNNIEVEWKNVDLEYRRPLLLIQIPKALSGYLSKLRYLNFLKNEF